MFIIVVRRYYIFQFFLIHILTDCVTQFSYTYFQTSLFIFLILLFKLYVHNTLRRGFHIPSKTLKKYF